MLDDLFEAAPRSTQTELRSLLGCFLFSEDDVFKTIGVLSGGERNRYALARMLLHPSNFLLLDEPTNHLDLRAKDVLLDSLQKFTGTVVFVSHDRYFIDKLATRVFEIGEGRVEVFPGNYEDYLWRKEGKGSAPPDGSLMSASNSTSTNFSVSTNHDETAKQTDPEVKQKRLNPIKLKQMKERLQEVEEEIARLEAAIATAETALQNFVSVEETQRQTDLLNRSKADLESVMNEWEELAQMLEAQAEV
jgi:ATP-binding cassette subfamily F protein 3